MICEILSQNKLNQNGHFDIWNFVIWKYKIGSVYTGDNISDIPMSLLNGALFARNDAPTWNDSVI